MKATSLFGGVQVFQILIAVVRSKFVAILLGPSGMGIAGLLTATTGLVAGLTNFGLGTSAVKNISEANATNDQERVETVISVLHRLVWITGLLGALVTLLFSPWLSYITFGNQAYTLAFIWISITLLVNQLSSGQMVLLQGLRRLHHLAKANVFGSLTALVVTVPLYYYLGIQGIVPVIIITAIVTFFFSWYFAKSIKTKKVAISRITIITEGKNMTTMGFMISLSGLITMLGAYLLRIYINRIGNVADVGYYTAGFTLINTYVGMIFTAMGTDYYPRLSLVGEDNEQCKEHINQQSEIALLLLAPILICFLVFIHWIVTLLYSSQFLGITGMVYWAALGIFFKAVSWAIAFVFLAKGAGKLFFLNEFVSNIYSLVISVLGYKLGGLTGLGFAFLIAYLIYLIQVYIIARVKYDFSFHTRFITVFMVQFFLAIVSFSVVKLIDEPYIYLFGTLLIVISGWYSFRELEQRIGIKEIIQTIIQKLRLNKRL